MSSCRVQGTYKKCLFFMPSGVPFFFFGTFLLFGQAKRRKYDVDVDVDVDVDIDV